MATYKYQFVEGEHVNAPYLGQQGGDEEAKCGQQREMKGRGQR